MNRFLYPTILSNFFISLIGFLVASLGFSIYSIMSSTNSNGFTLPFQFGFLLFFFSCMIIVDRISNTMLNKNGKSGHSFLVPNLRLNAFSFSPLNMIFKNFLLWLIYNVVNFC